MCNLFVVVIDHNLYYMYNPQSTCIAMQKCDIARRNDLQWNAYCMGEGGFTLHSVSSKCSAVLHRFGMHNCNLWCATLTFYSCCTSCTVQNVSRMQYFKKKAPRCPIYLSNCKNCSQQSLPSFGHHLHKMSGK